MSRSARWLAVAILAVLSTAMGLAAGLPPLSTGDHGRVEALLKGMTLEERIGQMTLMTSDWDVTGPTVRKDYLADIEAGRVGAIFNAYTAAFTRKLQTLAVERTRCKIPLLFGYDVIHGHRTIFPISLAETASWDLEGIERAARIAAREAAAEGLHWTFAPMVDVARDPRWGRISEGAGEDVHLGCLVARARVRGFQGDSLRSTDTILACAKHFAAYGAAQAGRDYHTVDLSERTLWSTYLPPFAAAIDEGAATVMTAFNELNGVPATANEFLLSKVLRSTWGFRGFVVTDYTSINEMVPHGYATDDADAARLAVSAGVDMDMQGSTFRNHLARLVAQGLVPAHRIEEAARRILEAKARLGLLDDPYRYCDEDRERRVVMAPEHLAFARDFARRCVVLLKNEPAVLPLASTPGRVALVGPLADGRRHMIGSWSAAGDWQRAVTVLEAFRERLGAENVVHAAGCPIDGDDRSEFAEARRVARSADIVVAVVGEGYDQSGEAACRTSLGLPGAQEALVRMLTATGKPLVLVVMSGRPLGLSWEAQHVPAIVQAWFLGTTAGHAVTDVLFGDHNPSARLPVTIPRNVGQIPLHYDMKNTGRPVDPAHPDEKYKSRYLDVPNTPLYPFGHGLSYTTFSYGDVRLGSSRLRRGAPIELSVEVRNTGRRDGDEVVQVYLHDRVGSVTRPVRQLADFRRIRLRRGERQRVSFSLPPDRLAFWRRDMTYGTEPGSFTVYVGGSSQATTAATFELVDD